jgi:UDP-GlcNAc:undecaprenyl-phosphate GlcNAc-1-phosphate transferase
MSSALYPLVPPFVAVVILLARLLMDFGYKLGLVDEPNERSSHTKIIPRVGGLAIFLPYLVLGTGFYITGYNYLQLQSGYWLGLGAIVALGTLDDRLDLSSSIKYFVKYSVAA